jgi:hypothetical protein
MLSFTPRHLAVKHVNTQTSCLSGVWLVARSCYVNQESGSRLRAAERWSCPQSHSLSVLGLIDLMLTSNDTALNGGDSNVTVPSFLLYPSFFHFLVGRLQSSRVPFNLANVVFFFFLSLSKPVIVLYGPSIPNVMVPSIQGFKVGSFTCLSISI